jgi:hypothetical protein
MTDNTRNEPISQPDKELGAKKPRLYLVFAHDRTQFNKWARTEIDFSDKKLSIRASEYIVQTADVVIQRVSSEYQLRGHEHSERTRVVFLDGWDISMKDQEVAKIYDICRYSGYMKMWIDC